MFEIGFLGGGNMARAIAAGLVASGFDPRSVTVMDRHEEKRRALEESYGVRTEEKLGPWIEKCSLVVLAVKPQGLKDVCEEAAPSVGKDATVLSIAAAVPAASIAGWIGSEHIVRAMPNTPATVRKGLTGLFAAPGARDADRERAESVMRTVGRALWVDDEAKIHLVTAGPGSGPAYVFLFMQVLSEALQAEGLAKAEADEFALSTVEGAAALARESGEDFEALRRSVTSKGGTTAKAIEVLEAHDLAGAVREAVRACRARSEEMSTLFG